LTSCTAALFTDTTRAYLLLFRCLLRYHDAHVYIICDHDCHRTQPSSPVARIVRDAWLGQLTVCVCCVS